MSKNNLITIGGVLFEGFEILDFFGPLEFFWPNMAKIVTLGEKKGPIKSAHGVKCTVDHAFGEFDPVDVLLIPGGYGTRKEVNNEKLIGDIRVYAEKASYVATVCTGTALLAKTGLLDGKQATTNKLAFEWVTSQGLKVNWVPEARWVEDGKFFTASGVSAGMDMALGLIEKLFDRETSLNMARAAEYEWHSDKTWDPFAKLAGLVK